mgnify:CR=1 FL=1
MNKNSLTYRFLRGYLIGFAIAGILIALPQVGTVAQLFLGLAAGVVGWTWLKNKAESNKK